MADLFPRITERGTTWGWTGRSQRDIDAENVLRDQANAEIAAGGDREEVLRKYGSKLWGSGFSPLPSSTQRLSEALNFTSPSSTVVNPDLPGPALQVEEPAIKIPGVTAPSDFASYEPPRLASKVFPGASPTTYTDEDVKNRAAGRDDLVGRPLASLYEGLPDYLRRPTSTQAAPPEDTFTPGAVRGRRETVPGGTLEALLRENPPAARAYMANREGLTKVQEDDAESAGITATRAYIRARQTGTSDQKAYDDYGAAMEGSKAGRAFLASIGVHAKDVALEAKTKREQDQYDKAQQYATRQAALYRAKTDDPDAQAMADMLEAQAADPKFADNILKFYELAQKRKEEETKRLEAKRPIVGQEGVLHQYKTDATGKPVLDASGQRVLEEIPGQYRKPASSWYTGQDLNELLGIAADDTKPIAVRQQALANYKQRIADQKSVAAAGQLKWSPAEIDDMQGQLVAIGNYRRIATMIRDNPTGWGGPGGWFAKLDRAMATAGWGDQERTIARNDIEQSGTLLRKAMFGTALSAHEAKFARWVPTGVEESVPELLAKLEATAENMHRALQYRVFLKEGGNPMKLPLMATPEGDVDLTNPRNLRPRLAPNERSLIDRHKG